MTRGALEEAAYARAGEGDFAGALAAFAQIEATHGADAQLANDIAVMLVRLGRTQDAVSRFRQAAALLGREQDLLLGNVLDSLALGAGDSATRQTRRFTIVLHIGTEKTGTSALQTALAAGASPLAAQGIHYLAWPGRIEARPLAAAAISENRENPYLIEQGGATAPEAAEGFRVSVQTWLAQTLPALPDSIHTVLVSSEHFHSGLKTGGDIARLRALLAPYAGAFRVVCYLRRQIDQLESHYSTALKSGHIASIAQWVSDACEPSVPYGNIERLLGLWAGVFGEHAVVPRLYGSHLQAPGALLEDFLEIIGAASGVSAGTSLCEINTAISPVGQALLLALNQLAASGRCDSGGYWFADLRSRILENFVGPGARLPADLAETLQARFDAGNEQVRARWFPQRAQLFEPLDRGDDDAGRQALSARQQGCLLHLMGALLGKGAAAPAAAGFGREQVIAGYELILGRPPENEAVIEEKLLLGSVQALRRELLASEEFAAGYRALQGMTGS